MNNRSLKDKIIPQGSKREKVLNRLFHTGDYRYPAWHPKNDRKMHLNIFVRKLLSPLGINIGNMKRIKSLKNSCLDETCFICGTAPSLTVEDLEKIKGYKSFGVNSIIACYDKTSWRPDYYTVVDYYAFHQYLSATNSDLLSKEYNFLHYRIKPKTPSVKNIFIPVNYKNHLEKNVKKDKIKFSSDVSVCVYDAFTVVNMAIQIAIYMGFSTIVLLGVDCVYNPEKRHFIETPMNDSQKEICDFTEITKKSINGLKKAKIFAEKNNVKILNASRGGVLDVFERVELDNFLKEFGND